MIVGGRPHNTSAGPALSRFLTSANSFIHNHFWRTVNFPAIAPGTPVWALQAQVDHDLEVQGNGGSHDGSVCHVLGQWKPG